MYLRHIFCRFVVCYTWFIIVACDDASIPDVMEIDRRVSNEIDLDILDLGVELDAVILDTDLRDLGSIDFADFQPSEPIDRYDPIPLVNPLIGTGGQVAEIASVSPGASAPNGLTLVGPDTRKVVMIPPYHCAGYHYPDTHIQGFSHTHAHGMGVVDYGAISVMPRLEWREEYISFEGRQAPFSHEAEWASPGRYGVMLQDDQTLVDIVATEHGAHHRYTFREDESEHTPVLIIDLGDNLETTETTETSLSFEGDDEVLIYQRLSGAYSVRFGGVKHYAVMRVSPAPIRRQGWSDDGLVVEGTDFNGRQTGMTLTFPQGTSEVHLRVALSFVDHEGARLNLIAELPDLDFEARLAEVESLWRTELSKVRVRGKEADVRRFTTAHYHSLLMPSLNSDVDGRYRGLDQAVHQADFKYYSDFSLWDTFRTLHSFYILAHPDLQLNMLKSLVRMYEDGGSLPRWPLAHGYTAGMIGTPATQVFAESALKRLEGWNQELAYEASLAQVNGEAEEAVRGGLESYLTLGWVPADERGGSVSRTLEFSWSDDALARWAKHLGHTAEADRLRILSKSWMNHWDVEQGFMVGRNADGQFQPLASSTSWIEAYIEGNAWHYLWYVPYDVDSMIEVQHEGDRAAFLSRLSDYWTSVYEEEDDLLPDDYYWHGNEPVLHYAWLGSLAGAPAITVESSHHILETRYGHQPEDGLDGNDDSGTLSTWYLWASMGLYPIAGTQRYALGAPIFDRVEIDGNRTDEAPLVIKANGADWYKIPNLTNYRGYPLGKTMITHEELLEGLEFTY